MLIWVTRTAPSNAVTARRLRRLGHEALCVPLLRVVPTEVPPVATAFDAVAFTSGHALRLYEPEPALKALPTFAVGPRTATIARRSGFREVVAAEGDVGSLQRLVARTLPARARVLHVCGQETARDMARHLAARHIELDRRVVYRTQAVEAGRLSDVLRDARQVGGVLVHSPMAAAALAQVLRSGSWSGHVWCLSEACAAPLRRLPGIGTLALARPSEQALLDLVARTCGNQDLLQVCRETYPVEWDRLTRKGIGSVALKREHRPG